jgi:hypothetical protein
MKNLVACSHKIVAVVVLLLSSIVVAQKSHKESFKVGEDVLVSVNVSYADVVFETWNKNVVEVEAYVEGKDLSEKEKQEILDNWELDILGNSKKVVVTSVSNNQWVELEMLSSLEELQSLESLKELEGLKSLEHLGDMDWNIVVPDVPDYEEFPVWPFGDDKPNVKSGKGSKNYSFHGRESISFDSEEYEKNKKAYVAKLNKKYKTNVSVKEVDSWLDEVDDWAEGFENVMEDWGEKFGKEFEVKFGPEFEKAMEEWGESFGKSMEAWGEEFGKEMEKWGEEFGKDVEKWAEQLENEVEQYSNEVHTDDHGKKAFIVKGKKGSKTIHSKANKKIIIRLPKGTKTDVNVRHGEVKMADAYNINATLNYASFEANSIDGGKSLINASYAPVLVNNWIEGELNVKYVEDCKLNSVQNINLHANSSDVSINSIREKAYLSGSFGNLFIYNVSDDFEVIDIELENTDAKIKIPNTAFSFYFNGKKSPFSGPTSLEINKNVNAGRVVLDGFYKANNPNKKFSINASYSNVSLQK